MLSRQFSRKGMGFGPVFFTLLFIAVGWLAVYYAIGYFGMAKAQTIMTETILANRQVMDDEILRTSISESLKNNGPILVKPEDVTVLRGDSRIKVSIKFVQRASVPFTHYGLDLPFTAEVEERTDVQRAF